MTPEQKIKREILLAAKASGDRDFQFDDEITEENVDGLYASLLVQYNRHWDFEQEFRESGEQTDISAPFSRNYDSYSVARKLSDESWIGWTYWHGGGKHGNPEEIPWMDEAYDLTLVKEEQKTITVREFKLKV